MNKTPPLSRRESAAFVKKVKTLLGNTGMSKTALAEIGNVKPSTLRMWLLGKNRVSVEGKETFEKALNDYLLDMYTFSNALEDFLGPTYSLTVAKTVAN